MSYQNSATHLTNLQQARVQLLTNRIKCSYCVKDFTKGNLLKHESSCYLNPSNLKPCPVCDKPIKAFKTGATCSSGCANTLFRTGPNHGNWSDKQYRSTCFHYHEKKCVVCAECNIVEVHHMDEDHNNNSPDNLIPLCPTHHQYFHSSFRSLVEPIILEYLKSWSSLRLSRLR